MIRLTNRKFGTTRALKGRLLVMLVCVVASIVALVGCSTEARYRIKTVIFTGVPPLQGEEAAEGTEQPQQQQSAKAEQLARQQQHRAAMIQKYWQHGPFAAGECGWCHSLGESKSFLGNRGVADAESAKPAVTTSSRLLMPKQQLCTTCHTQHSISSVRDRGLRHHSPAADGMCTACHNPHQSRRQYMLHKADNNTLCRGCHLTANLSPAHTPNSEQDCMACHNAHVGKTPSLLKSDGKELTLLYSGRAND